MHVLSYVYVSIVGSGNNNEWTVAEHSTSWPIISRAIACNKITNHVNNNRNNIATMYNKISYNCNVFFSTVHIQPLLKCSLRWVAYRVLGMFVQGPKSGCSWCYRNMYVFLKYFYFYLANRVLQCMCGVHPLFIRVAYQMRSFHIDCKWLTVSNSSTIAIQN